MQNVYKSFATSNEMLKMQIISGIKTFEYKWGFAKLQKASFYKYIDVHLCPIIDFSSEIELLLFNDDITSLAKKYHVAFIRVVPPYIYQKRDQLGNILQTDETATNALKSLNFKHLGYNQINTPQPLMLFLKDLSKINSETDLLKSYTTNARTLIKRAEKSFVTLRKAKFDDIQTVKSIIDSSASKHSFTNRPLEYYQNMFKCFGDKIEIVIAEINLPNTKTHLQKSVNEQNLQISKMSENPKKQGQIREINNQITAINERIRVINSLSEKYLENGNIAFCAYLFIWGENELVSLYGGTIVDFEVFSASYMLQKEMMLKAIKNDKKYFNFYGVSGKFDGSDGVLKFKQNFNGEIWELPGYFEKPINKFSYLLYKMLRKIRG